MDTNLIEWLGLGLRFLHVIAAIMWIGNSFYFMWLDSHLERPENQNGKVEGSLWMVHSGGFYQVERRKIFPGEMPKILHWFKWEATFTWISGIFLLGFVYYLSNGIYLLPASGGVAQSVGSAIFLSVSILTGSWFFYDIVLRLFAGKNKILVDVILCATLVILAHILSEHFSGRAAFIHIGAIFGTIMVLNVWVHILPGQSRMIAATNRGETPDYAHSKKAKARSTHNSYMTLPVLFMMISNHYPFLYGHTQNWIIILLLCILGASIRDIMLREKRLRSP